MSAHRADEPEPDQAAGPTADTTASAPSYLPGEFVLGERTSPVAVCTLASQSLLPALRGRPEVAIAGRVYTENIGIEKMVENLLANPRLRYLLICGRESRHRVGQAILSLHRNGADPVTRRILGATGPEPVVANLSEQQVAAFQRQVTVVDLIGEQDLETILERARTCQTGDVAEPDRASAEASSPPEAQSALRAELDPPGAWTYDPLGFFLVRVDRDRQLIVVEHYGQDRRLLETIEGETAAAIGQTTVRLGLLSDLTHAVYLGRELAKAEAGLRFDLRYEQDSPLRP